jgi:hypothetical protein
MYESGKNRLRNGVAVIVAVCFSTSPTFQAFESSSLCAQLPLLSRATWIEDEQAFNFVAYAERAESVMQFFYFPDDLANLVLTFQLDPLHNKSGRIWHCKIPLNLFQGRGPVKNDRISFEKAHWDATAVDSVNAPAPTSSCFDRICAQGRDRCSGARLSAVSMEAGQACCPCCPFLLGISIYRVERVDAGELIDSKNRQQTCGFSG